jgi:preprotein translocase subunit SecG
MLTALKITLLVMSIALIIVVLLQKGKSAGLSGAITGGAEHLFGRTKARGLDLFLSRVTLVLAILFIILTAIVAYSNEIPWLAEESATKTETAAPENNNNSQTINVTTPPADAKQPESNAKTPASEPSSTAPKATEPKATETSNTETNAGDTGVADEAKDKTQDNQ